MPSEHMSPETHLAQQALAVSQPTAISVWLRCRAVPVVMHWGGGLWGRRRPVSRYRSGPMIPATPQPQCFCGLAPGRAQDGGELGSMSVAPRGCEFTSKVASEGFQKSFCVRYFTRGLEVSPLPQSNHNGRPWSVPGPGSQTKAIWKQMPSFCAVVGMCSGQSGWAQASSPGHIAHVSPSSPDADGLSGTFVRLLCSRTPAS